MTAVWRPDDAEAVRDAVREAVASRLSLRIVGHDSRNDLGRPVQADVLLDLSALDAVVDYQPEELVLTVQPGASLADVQALLAENGQALGFEPPDFGTLWGNPDGRGTIGGAMISGFGGPAQLTAGGPRDHCLGVKAVNGAGDPWASGGRVVKNVTGFDLPKLICGSFGQLGVVTELTVKTTPARGQQRTVLLGGLDAAQAGAAMTAALAGTANVAAAAHVPADLAALSVVESLASGDRSATLLRLEGMALSVESRARALNAALGHADATILGDADSRRLWTEIAGARFFPAHQDAVVWRLSAPPAGGPEFGARLAERLRGRSFQDWAGGAIWLEVPAALDPGDLDIRPLVRATCGPDAHAMIVRAPAEIRASIPPFEPPQPAVGWLSRRLKQRFDPHGLFNPGRMYGDM